MQPHDINGAAIRTLAELVIEPPIRIRYLQGTNDRLVISFAGVGTNPHEEPPAEFFRLAQGATGANHVLFVSDESRSWMNAPGLAEAIAHSIEATVAELKPARVAALGNSMGGTMALIIAALTRLDAVLAITPQFSADPDVVPEEKRWIRFRKKIADFPFQTVGPLTPADTKITILHGATDDELHHALKFPASEAVHHYIFPELDHNLARTLQKGGKLAQIVENALDGRRWRTRKAVSEAGGIGREAFEAGLPDSHAQEAPT